MSEVLTAVQMKAIEAAAIASGAVTGLELMERAGQGVVAAVLAEWPELALSAQRAVVLCGPGGNGGDGFVVARLLAARGWAVEVYLYGDAAKLPPDARVNYARWCEVGEVKPLSAWSRRDGWHCDVLVDALFGIGLKRPLDDLEDLFWNMEDMVDCFEVEPEHAIGRPAIIAVDLPSGLCADSGRMLGNKGYGRDAAAAHITVTFHSPKPGHFLADGPESCGRLHVVDLGLDPEATGTVVSQVQLPRAGSLTKHTGHKFSHGHALIVSGDHSHAGAGRLAARGLCGLGRASSLSPRRRGRWPRMRRGWMR